MLRAVTPALVLRELLETSLRPAGRRYRGALASGVAAGVWESRLSLSLQQMLLHRRQHQGHRQQLRAAYCRSNKSEGALTEESAAKALASTSNLVPEKKRLKAGLLPSLEDLLFYTIAEGQEKIPIHKFITVLKSTGLRTSDPRLKECMDMLRTNVQAASDGVMLDKELFKKCVGSNIVLLTQAFRRKFVIPDFEIFASHIDGLHESAKKMSGGKVADYIPQLAKFSPDLWGVSLCTVDGQSLSPRWK